MNQYFTDHDSLLMLIVNIVIISSADSVHKRDVFLKGLSVGSVQVVSKLSPNVEVVLDISPGIFSVWRGCQYLRRNSYYFRFEVCECKQWVRIWIIVNLAFEITCNQRGCFTVCHDNVGHQKRQLTQPGNKNNQVKWWEFLELVLFSVPWHYGRTMITKWGVLEGKCLKGV